MPLYTLLCAPVTVILKPNESIEDFMSPLGRIYAQFYEDTHQGQWTLRGSQKACWAFDLWTRNFFWEIELALCGLTFGVQAVNVVEIYSCLLSNRATQSWFSRSHFSKIHALLSPYYPDQERSVEGRNSWKQESG